MITDGRQCEYISAAATDAGIDFHRVVDHLFKYLFAAPRGGTRIRPSGFLHV